MKPLHTCQFFVGQVLGQYDHAPFVVRRPHTQKAAARGSHSDLERFDAPQTSLKGLLLLLGSHAAEDSPAPLQAPCSSTAADFKLRRYLQAAWRARGMFGNSAASRPIAGRKAQIW